MLLYNAPANTSSGRAQAPTGSLPAASPTIREFNGRPVTANPPAARSPSSRHRAAAPSDRRVAQRRLVIGQATPAGPVRRKAHGMLPRKDARSLWRMKMEHPGLGPALSNP